MSDANVVDVLSLNEATDLVQHTGQDVSYLFLGEMGIGKSHMLYELGKRMPEYQCMYAEVPTFDTSDITGVPFTEVVNGVKVTRFAPNAMMNVQSNKPVLFLADEIGKGSRPVQNTFLRLFHEHRFGEHALPDRSIVFATSNLAVEGLGDHVQDHFRNRGSVIELRKPNAEEWIIWAMANGIHPVIIAWVKKFPRCLASYRDGDGNPYINYPTKPSKAFVSPRSLHKSSHIMWQRDKLPNHVTRIAIAGCVGVSAANDIMTFADTYDRLPSWEAIVASPDTAYVPDNKDFAGNFVSVFSAVSLVDRKTMAPWMAYCQRLPKEYQGVFALNVLTSPARNVALNNRAFVTWATQNHWLV